MKTSYKKNTISKPAQTPVEKTLHIKNTEQKNLFGLSSRQLTSLTCIICFIIVMIIQTKPLYPFENVVLGHDFQYHYLRTSAVAQKIRDGNIFTGGIDYLFNNGAGYASSTAYPDVMLIIPALLQIAGVGIGNSMSAFIIICSVLTYLSMFKSVKGITKSSVCASIACAISMLTFYRMDNLYTRFALGEVQAFIFWPLIFYGLYNFILEDFKKPYLIGIGFIGLMMTHTISTVIALCLCIIISLFYIREIIRTPKKIITLIVTAFAVLALTAYYWIPLLELLGSCELAYSHPYALSENFKVAFFDIFRDISVVGIGSVLFFLQTPRILLLKKSKIRLSAEQEDENFIKILKFADVSLILSLVMIFFASDKAPWSVLKHVLNFMQFPWRMYGAATIMMAFSAAVYVYSVLRNADARRIGLMAVTLTACLNIAVHADEIKYPKFYSVDDDYYHQAENTYQMGYGEWLPWNAKCAISDHEEEFKSRTESIYTNTGNTISGLKYQGMIKFEMPEETYEYVDVPFIWYKGYKAHDSAGNELSVSMSDMGFVRVDTSSASGTVEVKYHLSALAVVSYVISSLTAAGIVIVTAVYLKKKKARKTTVSDKKK